MFLDSNHKTGKPDELLSLWHAVPAAGSAAEGAHAGSAAKESQCLGAALGIRLQGCSESASKSRMQRAALPCTLCALFPAVNALFINSPRPTARGTALWKSPGASHSCALLLQTGPQLIKMTASVIIWYVEFHLSYRRCTCHQGVQMPPHLPTLTSCHIK